MERPGSPSGSAVFDRRSCAATLLPYFRGCNTRSLQQLQGMLARFKANVKGRFMFHIYEYEHISVDRSGRFGVYGCRPGRIGFLAEREHGPHDGAETPEPLEKLETRLHVERVETPEAAETPETPGLERGRSSN